MRARVLDALPEPTLVTVQPEDSDGAMRDSAVTLRIHDPRVGDVLRAAYLCHAPVEIATIEGIGVSAGYVVSAELADELVHQFPDPPRAA